MVIPYLDFPRKATTKRTYSFWRFLGDQKIKGVCQIFPYRAVSNINLDSYQMDCNSSMGSLPKQFIPLL